MSELSERLKEIDGLEIESSHMGLEEKTIEKSEWHPASKYLQDKWSVTIRFNNHSYTTEYYTGIGHRKLIGSDKKEGNKYWDQFSGQYKTEKEACKANWLKVIEPKLDDVMACFLIDAGSAYGTFEDFCGNFGYDSDSRKALEIYLNCQKTRDVMLKMFGRTLFEELSQLEH